MNVPSFFKYLKKNRRNNICVNSLCLSKKYLKSNYQNNLLLFKILFTCKIVKFSKTLFIIYFSGRCFNLCIKLIMYSHIGDRAILYKNLPFCKVAYSVSNFSTTCLPKLQTLVDTCIVMFSLLSYL